MMLVNCLKKVHVYQKYFLSNLYQMGSEGQPTPKSTKTNMKYITYSSLFFWHLGNVHSKSGTICFVFCIFSITFPAFWHIATKNNIRQINFQNNTSRCHGYHCMVIGNNSIFYHYSCLHNYFFIYMYICISES